MAIQLRLTPAYTVARTQSGPVVVDPTGLTIFDYPLDQVLSAGPAESVSFYWTGSSITSGDNVDIQVILLDVTNSRYIAGDTQAGLLPGLAAQTLVYGCPFTLRVTALSAGITVKDLQILAAAILPPPTRG